MTNNRADESNLEAGPDVVVVGFDGSKAAIDALEWAARYASAFGLKVRAVHAWHYPVDYGYAISMPEVDFAKDARDQVVAACQEAKSRYPAVEFETEVVNSPPATALLEVSEHAAMLVVGSRGHGGFTGMLLGSVSTHCAHHAHCPVTIVR